MKKLVIGIDIGGTNTEFGIFDKAGKCYAKNKINTAEYATFDIFFNKLKSEIQIIARSLAFDNKIAGIGIGAPNGNYYKGTIEFATNLRWQGVINVTKKFESEFNVPAVLSNDANAAAYGEMLYGGARNMKNFIVITLGTGLGSGIVVDGRLMFGHDGFAGELGHTIVDLNGRKCGCGRNGCLETYVSATGIKKTAIEFLEKSKTTSILSNIKNISAKDIDYAAKKGDDLAMRVFEYTGKILGIKLSDIVAITSPEAIFLYGGLSNAGQLIFKPVKYWMEHYLLNIFKNKVNILPSQINDSNAAILGAAALIWDKIDKS